METTSNTETEPDEVLHRSKARLNPTVAALLRRGVDNSTAERLRAAGRTLSSLKQSSDQELADAGLSAAQIAAIRKGDRAVIPSTSLAQLLWGNRWTCCVCRETRRAIIVHHIEPWANSHDHRVANLAVLCLDHHAKAHTVGDLEQNLTALKLRDAKMRWEEAVSHLDARAILEASRLHGQHWWWFNHRRLLELAASIGLDLSDSAIGVLARRKGMIDKADMIAREADHLPYLYEGGDGNYLYSYMSQVLEGVLTASAVFDVSDDLDRGVLSQVVRPGDLIAVQGKHFFKSRERVGRRVGPGQVVDVRRSANGVRISYTADRWEAVANSAWASWMMGAQRAVSIVRVIDAVNDGPHLHLKCTGLAVGFALPGLANRSYVFPTWRQNDCEDEEDWLAGDFEES